MLTATWTWFHVPAFLLVSGFLYCSERPASLYQVAQRLSRVWIPYVLATLFMQLTGTTMVANLGQALFQIATATALGPYYYIALISGCILMLWPLSRLDRGGAAVLLAALFAYAIALVFWPAPALPRQPRLARAQSAGGVRARLLRAGLGRGPAPRAAGCELLARHRFAIACVAGVGVVYWFASIGDDFNRDLISLKPRGLHAQRRGVDPGRDARAPRAAVVRLPQRGDAHHLPLPPGAAAVARTWVRPWPPPLRIGFQLALGVGAGCLLAFVGRRVLGAQRARRYLGA